MTLVAAFRGRNNGVLLCADREQTDDYALAKREVDKVYRVCPLLHQAEVFISGSGPSEIFMDACGEIHESLAGADKEPELLIRKHRSLIEQALTSIHSKYSKSLKNSPLCLVIVVAPRAVHHPLIYRSNGNMLIPEQYYVSEGNGKVIADYLADHLYKHGLDTERLKRLAIFIFREAHESRVGVGKIKDMILIDEEKAGTLEFMGHDTIEEIESKIPPLWNLIWNGLS